MQTWVWRAASMASPSDNDYASRNDEVTVLEPEIVRIARGPLL